MTDVPPSRPLPLFDIEPPYDVSRRPAKIVDSMWETIGNYRLPDVAFNSLVDLLIMLVAKPVAITFFKKDGRLYRHLLSTMSEADTESPFGPCGQIVSGKVLEKFHCFDVPPLTPGKPSSLVAILSAVTHANPGESQDGDADDEPRKVLLLKPYQRRDIRPDRRPPQGLDYDLWCVARLFEELKRGSERNHQASLLVLESIHSAATMRRPGRIKPGDVGALPWGADRIQPWDKERKRIVSAYWRQMLTGVFPAIEGETPTQKLANALEFIAVFRCALPEGQVRAGIYDYTANVVLSRDQRQAARAFLPLGEFSGHIAHTAADKARDFVEFGSDPDVLLEVVQRPLSASYRSIADTPFMSGFADFALEVISGDQRQSAPLGASEEEVLEHEKQRLAEALLFEERGNQSLYVPVHVGGVPWINLLILHQYEPGGEVTDNIWERRYQAYRGQVAIIAARLRAAAKQTYVGALGDELRSGLTEYDRKDWLATVNKRWRELSAFFPYHVFELTAVRGSDLSEDQLRLPWGEIVEVVPRPNPHTCFRRDKLDFDSLDTEPLLSHLRSVVAAAAAERFHALATQEGAFAHDVKHWTNPIREDIRRADEDFPDESRVRSHLSRARLHLNILNACADARNQAMHNRRNRRRRDAKEWMLKAEQQKQVVAAAFELLLHLHTRTIEDQSDDDGPLRLCWESEWPSLDAIFAEMGELLFGDADASPEDIVAQPPMLWPLGLLREVVHNMRINWPIAHPNYRTISIDYQVGANQGGIELIVRQVSADRSTFPDHQGLKGGINLANGLYGALGANKGLIGEPEFEQDPIKVETLDGQAITAFHIDYTLRILFY